MIYVITELVAGFVPFLDPTLDPTVRTGTGIDRAQILSALIGVVIPIVGGLVMKYSDSGTFKAVTHLALNAANGFFSEWLVAENFVWQQALFGTFLSFLVSTAMLFNLWKPTGVDDKVKGMLRKD